MSWLSDASANKIVQSYINNFMDISGNFKVRNAIPSSSSSSSGSSDSSAWSAYGQELTGPNESDNQVSFGMSCDMNASGTTIVVGAIDEDGAGSGTNDGVARVYTYNSATSLWVQLGNTISESNGSDLGYHTSINDAGDRILVVDPGSNHARIYDYNSGTNTWDNIGTLSQYPLYAFIGHMSGDGNTVMIGDHTSTSSAGPNSGNDYIYRYDGSTWTLIGQFIGTASSDYAGPGATLSYDGNRFIHGVQNDDSNGLSNNGRATVYDYSGSGTAWNQVGSHLYGDVNSGRFGGATDMSLDGSIIAIGAYYGNYVKVYEYSDNTNDWVQRGSTLIGPTGTSIDDYYGASLCISHDGNTLVVNERDNDDGAIDGGAIYVYTYTNGDWVQKGTTLTSTYSGAKLGYMHNISLAVSGDGSKIVAGGYGADANGTDSGYVQAFQWSSAIPGSELATLDISGGTINMLQNTMDISSGVVDISGTTWINRGQSGATIADAYQGALIIESNKTDSSDAVLHVETAGQTQAFSIRANGDLYSDNALRHSSDDRRKINEQHITNAMETLNKLSPQIYTKLNDLVQNGGTPTKTESGLIAQEIYYNAPELRHLVTIEDENGNKLTPQEYDLSGNDIQNDPDYTALGWGNNSAYVDYIGLIPYLIKSNQEKQAILDAQESTISQQTTQIDDLKTRLSSLESK